MGDKVRTLRKQLDCLGYTDRFTADSLPLVQSLAADLVQTTYSLQHYMQVAKEALQERDAWKGAAEPYKCENAKLIRDNNQLHLEMLQGKEELTAKLHKLKSDYVRLHEEYEKLQEQNKKLAARQRDYQLKSISADTVSSSKRVVETKRSKACSEEALKIPAKVACAHCIQFKSQIEELTHELTTGNTHKSELLEKMRFVKAQVSEREKEIRRLNGLLEEGRPVPITKSHHYTDSRDVDLAEARAKLFEFESMYDDLNKQLKGAFEKQHEAMTRAIQLSEKNNVLESHLRETDRMALKVEQECNARLKENHEIIKLLQEEVAKLSKDLEEKKLDLKDAQKSHEECGGTIERKCNAIAAIREALEEAKEDNRRLLEENKELTRMKTSLQNKLELKFESEEYARNLKRSSRDTGSVSDEFGSNITKEDLLKLVEKERKYYESHINEIKNKLNEQTKLNCMYKDTTHDRMEQQKLKEERDFYYNEFNNMKLRLPSEPYTTDLQSKVNRLEHYNADLEKKIKLISEENNGMKYELESSKRLQRDYDIEKFSRPLSQRLEKDLTVANKEIKMLEHERDMLLSRINDLTKSEATYKQLYENKSSRETALESSLLLKQEYNDLKEKLKVSESELMHTKSLYTQLKSLQMECDKNVADSQSKVCELRKELNKVRSDLATCEKQKSDMEYEIKLLRTDKASLKDNVNKIDKERDQLVMNVDNKTERLSSLEHQLRTKNTSIELLENKITEYNRKLELLTKENTTLEHKIRDNQTCGEALSLELDTITKQRDNALIENRRLQSDLATVTSDFRSLKREYDHSRKEVDEMKQQLQHYVDEVRRIEDILSRKEAERTEMLDHFASLSHETTVLESNNHSLENEAASKGVQLQAATEKLTDLEKKLKSREGLVEMQEEKIASLLYKISTLESDLAKQKELTKKTEMMLAESRETCSMLESQKQSILIGVGETDSERKAMETELNLLKKEQRQLEDILSKDKATIECLETLLADSRREVVEIKISMKETLEENSSLKNKIECYQKHVDIVKSDNVSSRMRSEEAAKQLQHLQQQMTDRRYERVHSSRFEDRSSRSHSYGTL